MLLNTDRIYHFFLYLLGIRIKLIDFNCSEIDRKTPTSIVDRFFKCISAIAFLIFVIIYPIFITDIISFSPTFGNKKRIEYFVVTLNFYLKFVTVIIVFICEFVCEKRALAYQNVIKNDLIQLQHVYSHWFVHLKGRTFKSNNWNESLAKLTNVKTSRGLITISLLIMYNAFICMRLANNIQQIKVTHIYLVITICIPNFYITLFIWHLSEICVQYMKMFRLLDEIIEVIANDICHQLSMRTKKHNRFKYFVIATMNEHKLNTAINYLATAMECHNNLKNHVLKMRTLYALQTNIVVLSDFVNVIIEVRIILTAAFG